MKRFIQQFFHYLVLISVTALAVCVMWYVSGLATNSANNAATRPSELPTIARPKELVAIQTLNTEICDVYSTFTGKVRPWETYSLGFEVAGRVADIGRNNRDQQLDDGDHVATGQLLARLDDRIFRARKSEATATLEEAEANMGRVRQLRERSPNAITETDFQEQLTLLALARAQHEVAIKNLEDSVLTSPVDATISRRLVNVGESVTASQVAFELVQNEEVLLVVDVPESQIREMEMRMRAVRRAQQHTNGHGNEEDRVFRAYVTLEGRDRFGNRWPRIEAEVYRIAELADPRTGLFEVEVRVPNDDGLLRPGMVATARIVTARIRGYKVPETAVVFRGRDAHLFTVQAQPADMQVMFWNAGTTKIYSAARVTLDQWIDQGAYLVVPAKSQVLKSVVVRGQHRLADDQLVRIVGSEDATLIDNVEDHVLVQPISATSGSDRPIAD